MYFRILPELKIIIPDLHNRVETDKFCIKLYTESVNEVNIAISYIEQNKNINLLNVTMNSNLTVFFIEKQGNKGITL